MYCTINNQDVGGSSTVAHVYIYSTKPTPSLHHLTRIKRGGGDKEAHDYVRYGVHNSEILCHELFIG